MKFTSKENIIPFFVALIAIFVLLTIPFNNRQYLDGDKNLTILEEKSTVYKYPANRALSIKVEEILIENENAKIIYDSEVANGVFVLTIKNKNNEYQTYFIDMKTVEEVGIYSLIVEEKYEDFHILIEKILALKYPKYISDELINQNVNRSYIFTEVGIDIYFDTTELSLSLSEEIKITLNYSNLVNILDYDIDISDKETENNYVLDKNKKTVAFTFDDGPSKYTDSILNILEENHANATFFVIGNLVTFGADTIKKTIDLGNEVGSHSYDHAYMTKQSVEELIAMHKLENDTYYAVTGDYFKMTRPPYGSINSKVVSAIKTPFIMWSLDTRDWEVRDTEKIVEKVMDNIRDGDIVLFHDIYPTTVEAVRILLPKLYANGYQITTVSKLAELKGVSLENETIYKNFYRK